MTKITDNKRTVISIHAPRVGSDDQALLAGAEAKNFNPRSPCGERRCANPSAHSSKNFNLRSPCGERPIQIYKR